MYLCAGRALSLRSAVLGRSDLFDLLVGSGQRYLGYRFNKVIIFIVFKLKLLRLSVINRKKKKRNFRALWIARINAAARMNGISYSKLMYGLKLANVDINRKMLAEMAVNDSEGFAKLAETAKSKIA